MATCMESLGLGSAQPEQLYIVVLGENQFTRLISFNFDVQIIDSSEIIISSNTLIWELKKPGS